MFRAPRLYTRATSATMSKRTIPLVGAWLTLVALFALPLPEPAARAAPQERLRQAPPMTAGANSAAPTAPLTPRRRPSRASSPRNMPLGTEGRAPMAEAIPIAIGRSRTAPSFGRSAGARLTATRPLTALDVAHIVDDGGPKERWIEENGCSGVLIRPDGDVFALIDRREDFARRAGLLPV